MTVDTVNSCYVSLLVVTAFVYGAKGKDIFMSTLRTRVDAKVCRDQILLCVGKPPVQL